MLFILVRLHHYACWTKACVLLPADGHQSLPPSHGYIRLTIIFCNTYYSKQLKMAFRAFSSHEERTYAHIALLTKTGMHLTYQVKQSEFKYFQHTLNLETGAINI